MSMQTVTLKLPDVMLQAAQKLAIQNDVTVGQIVRDLLVREMHNTNRAKTSGRTDEELLASLQTLLASDMGAATSWDDLERRLQANGYNLRPAGGELTLHRTSNGERLCKASELGFAYGALVRRFGEAMPGHPHGVMPGHFRQQPEMNLIEQT
jgi:hypothetical protein